MRTDRITDDALMELGFYQGRFRKAWRIMLPTESLSQGEYISGFVQLVQPPDGHVWTAEIHTDCHAEGRCHRSSVALPRSFELMQDVEDLLRLCGVPIRRITAEDLANA